MKKILILIVFLRVSGQLLFCQTAQPAGVIKGKILTENLVPIPYATVQLEGDGRGAVSDLEGHFTINHLVDSTYSIVISFQGFEKQRVSDLIIKNGDTIKVDPIVLIEKVTKLSEVVVSPSSFSVMGSHRIAHQTLTEKDLKNMSWAEDITRAVTRLPGVASNDFSSKFTVRGGESDEVLMLLDGMELYEPFHQRDFVGGLFSIVDIETISSVDLLTGGFGAKFGQRQSGVFQMKTKYIPDNTYHTSLGLSVMNIRVCTSGNLAKNRGKYLLSARRGILDLALKAVGLDETIPTYYDALFKAEYDLNGKNQLAIHNLYAGDKTEVNDIKPDNYDKHRTKYTNNYTWLTLRTSFNPNLHLQTILYGGYISHHRHGLFHKRDFTDKGDFNLNDTRKYTFGGLKQDWVFDFSQKFALTAGFDIRHLKADYKYSNYLNEIRVNQNDSLFLFTRDFSINTSPSGETYVAYVSGKTLITQNLIAELGFRYDKVTYTHDDLISPRVAINYSVADNTFIRAAYGYYYQSQFINNLDVNHNGTVFNPAELSIHYVLGFEHRFNNKLNFRVEAYYKDISHINAIYENLRDPLETFPESRNDVIKLDVSDANSKGIEFFFKYDNGGKLSWWFSYALAKAEDDVKAIEFDGILKKQTGMLPRPFNQTHTIYVDANYQFNAKWKINISWQYYNGLPLTKYNYAWQRLSKSSQLGQETATVYPDGDLQFYPEHHLYRGEKYPAYHKADLRMNRIFYLKNSQMTAFIHIINIYNHFNLRKFDLGVQGEDELLMPDGNGGYKITHDNTSWFGITPLIGISWDFDY